MNKITLILKLIKYNPLFKFLLNNTLENLK